LYKINKKNILKTIILRGHYLTKKMSKKNSKQTLIFLRAPKHFNIGKHKISSFVNFKKYVYNFNYIASTIGFNKNKFFFYNLFNIFHNMHLHYSLTSIKVRISVKIKWCD